MHTLCNIINLYKYTGAYRGTATARAGRGPHSFCNTLPTAYQEPMRAEGPKERPTTHSSSVIS